MQLVAESVLLLCYFSITNDDIFSIPWTIHSPHPHPELNPAVQAYLDEHLLRSINLKSALTMKAGKQRPHNLRRRMSVKGAIKKTRSINVDCKYSTQQGSFSKWSKLFPQLSPFLFTNAAETLGMEGNLKERRLSVAVTPLWLDSSNTSVTLPPAFVTPDFNRDVSPCPESLEDGFPPNKVQIQNSDLPRIQLPSRHRGVAETFENTEVEELIAMLRETENLEDQGDILQYLVDTQGLDFNTGEYKILDNMTGSILGVDGMLLGVVYKWHKLNVIRGHSE